MNGVPISYWISFIAYSLLMIAIGYWSYKKHREHQFSAEEYWIASREMAGLHLGISLTAGWTEVIWSLWVVGALYTDGYWTGMVATPLPMFILILAMFAIVKPIRAFPAISQPDMVEMRYGRRARITLACLMFPIYAGWGASAIVGMNILSTQFLGISKLGGLILVAIIVGIYATMGGFRSVVYTDVVQMSIVFVTFIVLAIVAIVKAFNVSGPNIFSAIAVNAPPNTGSFWHMPWATFIVTMLAFLPGWLSETDMWLRLQSAKNIKEAYKGVTYCLTWYSLATGLSLSLIGIAALVLYPPASGILPGALGGDATNLVPVMIKELFPEWFVAISLAGLVAAMMSSVDTAINVAALTIGYDVIQKHLYRGRDLSERETTAISRYATIAALVVSVIMAWQAEFFTDVLYLVGAWMTCTQAIPLFGMWWERATEKGATLAMLTGFFGSIIFMLLEKRGILPVPATAYGTGYVFYTVALTIIVLIIGSYATSAPTEEQLVFVRKHKPFRLSRTTAQPDAAD